MLDVEGELFLATWERRSALPPAGRRRLVGLLKDQEERLRKLRNALEHD